jgi:hypothetical protein
MHSSTKSPALRRTQGKASPDEDLSGLKKATFFGKWMVGQYEDF